VGCSVSRSSGGQYCFRRRGRVAQNVHSMPSKLARDRVVIYQVFHRSILETPGLSNRLWNDSTIPELRHIICPLNEGET
jgi:hypothetical protein